MAIHSIGFEIMVIADLTRFTFSIPGRILHQLGLGRQNCAGSEDFCILDFNAQTLNEYQSGWSSRKLEGPDPNFCTSLESHYSKWLNGENRAKQSNY
ncbi:hypothetical protein RHMOL_Rhmol08G0174700 [Rhododendron molle]|nr:hypothetical protein RHMOL_Rhmol08G0174700 [Rhododendron molle]